MNYVIRSIFILLCYYLFLGVTLNEDNTLYKVQLPEVELVENRIDLEEVKLLTAIIYAEGSKGKEDYSAIACVVVNRSLYKKKSIESVIYQKGQFDGLHTSRFKKAYKQPEKYKVAYDAALGSISGRYQIPISVQYFHNPSTSTDKKWTRYIEKYVYADIGQHRFCHNPKLIK